MYTYSPLKLPDEAINNLSRLLTPEERGKLFEELCDAVGGRIIERVHLETGIRQTDVYRYLPKTKSKRGGLIPSPATTAKVIKALLKLRRNKSVVKLLENASYRAHSSSREYFKWVRLLRKNNFINNPWSDSEISHLR
jgi:ArsR family metal-binding transcriptional regulator